MGVGVCVSSDILSQPGTVLIDNHRLRFFCVSSVCNLQPANIYTHVRRIAGFSSTDKTGKPVKLVFCIIDGA